VSYVSNVVSAHEIWMANTNAAISWEHA